MSIQNYKKRLEISLFEALKLLVRETQRTTSKNERLTLAIEVNRVRMRECTVERCAVRCFVERETVVISTAVSIVNIAFFILYTKNVGGFYLSLYTEKMLPCVVFFASLQEPLPTLPHP